jgi:precorrin-4/cobalt-precorrin-4 C11-methyltransferase
MIIASPTLGARHWDQLIRSKLYDPAFTHRFRKAASFIAASAAVADQSTLKATE